MVRAEGAEVEGAGPSQAGPAGVGPAAAPAGRMLMCLDAGALDLVSAHFCHLLAVGSWANHLASLNLSFLTLEMVGTI